MASAALEMIIFGLCTAISGSFLQSGPPAGGARAQQLDATLQVLLLAAPTVAFFVAASLLYAHIICTGVRAGANRPIAEAITFTLCAAVGLLELFLLVLSGGMDGGHAPPLDAAVQMLLPASATVTFFLAMALAYVHLRTSAGNEPIPEAVERLTKMTLGAAVVTAMLSLMVVVLTFGSERIA